MKITFVTRDIDVMGGAEKVTIIIANELCKRGYDVQILSLQGNSQPFFYTHPQLQLHSLIEGKDTYGFPFKDIRRKKRIKAYLQAEHPDIVVLIETSRSLTALFPKKGCTLVCWDHLNLWVHPHHPNYILSRKRMAKRAAAIVSLTEVNAEAYRTQYGAQQVRCIPNPITIDLLPPSPQTDKVVLAVGRYASQKGFDWLLQAWSLIPNPGEWELHIVGSGPLQKKLEEQIVQLGIEKSVCLLPPSHEMAKLYQKASIYALSSRYEGLPLVLIESGAMGLPSVSFDCKTGPADILVPDKTGILVPFADIPAFASALQKLMEDDALRQQMSQAVIQDIQQRYTMEPILKLWEKLIHDLTPQA